MGSCSSKEEIRWNQRSGSFYSREHPLENPRIRWQDPVDYRQSATSRSLERPSYYGKEGVPHYNHQRSPSEGNSTKSRCVSHWCASCAPVGMRQTADDAPYRTSQTQTGVVPQTFVNASYANSPTERLSLMHPGQDHPDPSNTPLATTGRTVDGRYQLEFVCNGASVEAESFVGQDKDQTTHLITRHIIRHPNCVYDPKKGELHIAILQKMPVDTTQPLDMKPLVYTTNVTGGIEEGDLMVDAIDAPAEQLEPERDTYSPNFIFLGYDPKRTRQKKKSCQQKIPVVQTKEPKSKTKRSRGASASLSEEPDSSLLRSSQAASTTIAKQDASQLELQPYPDINGQPGIILVTEPVIVPVIVKRNARYIPVSSIQDNYGQANKTSDVDVKISEVAEQFINNGSCTNLISLDQPGYTNFDQNEIVEGKISVSLPSGSHSIKDYEMDRDAESSRNTSGSTTTPAAPLRIPQEQMPFASKSTDNVPECSIPAALVYTTLLNEPREVEAFEEWSEISQAHDFAVHVTQRGSETVTTKEVKRNSRRTFFDLLTSFKRQEPQTQMLGAKTYDTESGPVAPTAQENTLPMQAEKNTTVSENTGVLSEQLPDQTSQAVPENSVDDTLKATCTCTINKKENGNLLYTVDKTVNMRLLGNPVETSVRSMTSVTTPKMAMEVMLDTQQMSPFLQGPLRRLNAVKPTNREQTAVALRSKTFVSPIRHYSSDRTKCRKGSEEGELVNEGSKLDASVPSFLPPIENVHTNTMVSDFPLPIRTSKTEQNGSVTLPKLRQSGSNHSEHKTGASVNRNNHIPNKSSSKTRKKDYDILVLHPSK
ncbi:hypothetical protein CRM22_005399 [Opisthorchis felineus]|uniref:Uncharacterized protein n=1 Tax=Opisthorchis felineus TaxID=147828 RepID=A0A4S2LY41_OPIFE|nr:hypothetical protein CRM22_005399 [Opisthorchis felineus]